MLGAEEEKAPLVQGLGDSHVRGPSVVCHPRKTVGGRVKSVLPALCNTHTDTHTQIYRHTHTQRQRYTETHI